MTAKFLLAALFVAACGSAAVAAPLATPTGPVILEVTGKVATTNNGAAADFDMAMLDQLPAGSTTTKTPWYDGAKTFTGPLGSALLDAVGATGDTMVITALNDYVSEVPVADFRNYPVVLATKVDGEPMSVRDKGPIFVIYPFDASPELNNETYYGRSAWQVKSIEIK
jgi:hypothetical protein